MNFNSGGGVGSHKVSEVMIQTTQQHDHDDDYDENYDPADQAVQFLAILHHLATHFIASRDCSKEC